MTDPNIPPELLAMARRIVATIQFGPLRWREADVLLSGKLDNSANVQIAIATILETSELAAKWLRYQATHEGAIASGADVPLEYSAIALRNQEHLP